MKVLNRLVMVPFFVALLSIGAVAQEYGSTPLGPQAIPPDHGQFQGEMQGQMEGQVLPGHPGFFKSEDLFYYTGTLSAINPDKQEIYVNTTVPGLLGPQQRDFPFRVDKDTTMTVCIRSLNACDSRASGIEGWKLLNNLESFTTLSGVRKNVIVVGAPDTNRIVHVQIEYDI